MSSTINVFVFIFQENTFHLILPSVLTKLADPPPSILADGSIAGLLRKREEKNRQTNRSQSKIVKAKSDDHNEKLKTILHNSN